MLTLPQGVASKMGNTVTTNAAGKVDTEFMSTIAGGLEIETSVENPQKTVKVKFKADFSTGQASLEVDAAAQKVASDKDALTLTAAIKDQYDGLPPGVVVVFDLPRGVKPPVDGNIVVNADKEGKAGLKMVSVAAGTYGVTTSIGNGQLLNVQSVMSVADKTTATISGTEVTSNRVVTNGRTKQTYKVMVTDASNDLLKDSEVTLATDPKSLVLTPNGAVTTDEQGQAIFTTTTTIAATYTPTVKMGQADSQEPTKTAESRFVADDKNAVLAASPERVDSLVANGKTIATLTVTLMSDANPVGGTMRVDIEAPGGMTEVNYRLPPSKSGHFASGKITRTFNTSEPGTYTSTFNPLTYGGYETKLVTVTINAVPVDTKGAEEK